MNGILGILSAALLFSSSRTQNIIPLVGFFEKKGSQQEMAFRLTLETINNDKSLLQDTTLLPKVYYVSASDSFNLSRTICRLAKEGGVGALLGPHSTESTGIVNSISNMLALPHLQTRWDTSSMPATCTVNLFPDPHLFSKALLQVIDSMDWRTFAIIYENSDALIRLQEVIKAKNQLTLEGLVPFTVWQLGEEFDQRPLLKEIKNTSETHILLDCSVDKILRILHQAKEVNLLTGYHSYIITSLDAHTLDYTEFLQYRVNITTLRLVDPQRHSVQAAVHDWIYQEARRGRRLNLSPDTVTTEAALMHDAVVLYAKALNEYSRREYVHVDELSCHTPSEWAYGYSIISRMKLVPYEGMTGRGIFDMRTGRRSFFTLELVELTSHGFRKIGSWDPSHGINTTRTRSEIEWETFQAISNRTFRVVSRIGEPYLRLKEGEGLEGNDRFEGYSMDLIEEISKILKFKYEFHLVPDKEYGSYNKETKQWNGLIRELRDGRADLAICDLTITYDRRSAVDFTMPFMTLGVSILFSKPPTQGPSYFSFLSPFSGEVWMCMATALLSISLAMYFLSRCSPYEWENPHPCNPNNEVLECSFSLQNCLWFAIGTLMQQGGDISPKAFSTRLVTGFWGFFVLLMISSYTANLAAFLTSERMESTITSVQDLAKQNRIKYGVLLGGSTANFFRDSNDSLYSKIWSTMESTRPSVFVHSNDEGVERVLKGKRQYAYFMESTSIEYQVEQHCELMQVGSTLDSKGYGIAMPSQFPYRTAISGAVLNLQESGKLLQLKKKWWKDKHGKSCGDKKVKSASNELGISSAGGVFLVLILGCTCAFFVSVIEFIWNVRKVAVQEKISPKEAFYLEMKACFAYYGTSKPIRKAAPEEYDTTIPINYIDHINATR